MKDINQFSQVNNIYGKFFKDHQPARAAFQVIVMDEAGCSFKCDLFIGWSIAKGWKCGN